MKLPGILANVLSKKPEEVVKLYTTCVFHRQSIDACVWDIGPKGRPQVTFAVSRELTGNEWKDRQIGFGEAITELRATGETGIGNVVLGLPSEFLAKNGDIEQSLRKDLGVLLKQFSLTPLGFVPVHQAIIYSLKQEDGIPPNVILLDVSLGRVHVYLYKIGQLSGEQIINTSDGIVPAVEKCLTGFADVEVMPSRLLLYGGDLSLLQSSQAELLKHPWQQHSNFLHFPKIDIYERDEVLAAVSLAGASELSLASEPELDVTDANVKQTGQVLTTQPVAAKLAALEPIVPTVVADEEPNVEVVSPDALGFHTDEDASESPTRISGVSQKSVLSDEIVDVSQKPKRTRLGQSLASLSKLSVPKPRALRLAMGDLLSTKGILLIPVSIGFLAVVVGLLYWFVPKATVTVYVMPQAITESQNITIDPEASGVDPEKKVVPGKLQEKSLSGERTVPVTGKKKVGDPARGTVTIYNKSPSLRTFKKGSVIVSGNLQFTLDADVQVASASENLASSQLTYGKVNSTITAASIGPESNMPANTDFQFKDISSSIAIIRNEQPLTGGTSRDVSVVTRNDQDSIVKLLSDELMDKAKTELTGSLTLSDTLIEDTVKTAIAQKTFSKELNEEAAELSGSITVNATGITYAANDVLAFLKETVTARVPTGYALLEEETKTDIGEVEIAKNGLITTEASIHSVAAAKIDTEKIQSEAVGKTITELQDYFKTMQGIGGISLTLQRTPFRSRLPFNKANISVAVAVHR